MTQKKKLRVSKSTVRHLDAAQLQATMGGVVPGTKTIVSVPPTMPSLPGRCNNTTTG